MNHSSICSGKVALKKDRIEGFAGFSKMTLTYQRFKRKTCFIYHLFLDRLSEPEKMRVIRLIAREMAEEGVDGISIPNTGYFETGFLKKMGFKEFPFKESKTNLYITMFKEKIPWGHQEPFYLEII